MFKKLLAGLATLVLGIGLATAAASPALADNPSNTNDPVNWAVNGETCTKYDLTSDKKSFTYAELLAQFASKGITGKTVTKVVIKSGSSGHGGVDKENEAYYSDPLYKFDIADTHWNGPVDLTTTSFVHPSGKDISHVIVCWVDPAPTSVSGAATPNHQECDSRTGDVAGGSITPDTSKTGVTYQLYGADKDADPALIEDFTGESGQLDPGIYWVKVLPLSDEYTVSEENTWIQVEILAYLENCQQLVTGAATPTHQQCEQATGDLLNGTITPDTTKVGVTYELWKWTENGLELVDGDFDEAASVPPGIYWVKVVPANDDYAVAKGDKWIKIKVKKFKGDCDDPVKVVGDPVMTQFCQEEVELDARQRQLGALTASWVSYLTITTSDAEPAGSVQYRVYFWDGSDWVDKGIWPEGTYHAGEDPGNPYELPYSTTIKVVAEATDGYFLVEPQWWVFEVMLPDLCEVFGLVEPDVTFKNTCAAGPTFTLVIEGGAEGTVLWSVNGGPAFTELGTYPVPAPGDEVTITATPGPDSGFPGDAAELVFSKAFDEIECLDTLALTGSNASPFAAIAGLMTLLGVALVRASRRQMRNQEV